MNGTDLSAAPGANTQASVSCPAGKVAIAGGYFTTPQAPVNDTLALEESFNNGQVNNPGNVPNGTWTIVVQNQGGTTLNFRVTATCANAST
jgi:hypothetical protein